MTDLVLISARAEGEDEAVLTPGRMALETAQLLFSSYPYISIEIEEKKGEYGAKWELVRPEMKRF